MQKKQIILIFLGIVVFMVFFWIFFIDNTVGDIVGDTTTKPLPLEDTPEDTPKQEYELSREERIFNYITNIYSLMNNKNYDELYSLLAEDFKKEKFNSFDTFKSYMDSYIKDKKYEPKFKEFHVKDDLYVVLVDVLQKEYTQKDLIEGTAQRIETIAIKEYGENDYKYSFDGFISSKKLKANAKTSGPITMELVRLNTYTDTRELFFKIKNDSDKKLRFSTTKLFVDADFVSPTALYRTYEIPAGQTKELSIKYYMNYDTIKNENTITLTGVKVGDKNIVIKIPIQEEK